VTQAFIGTSALSSDSSLYWDNTNNRLGIGITTPGDRLTVDGGNIRILSGNKLILNRANNGTNSEIYTDTTGKIILNSVNSEGIGVQNAGSTVLTVTSAGRVGIGTTAPQGKVHISATSTQLVLETPNATNDIDFRFRENGSNKWNFRYQNSSSV